MRDATPPRRSEYTLAVTVIQGEAGSFASSDLSGILHTYALPSRACGVLAVLAGPAHAEERVIVAFGDSLTAGLGVPRSSRTRRC